MNTYLKLIYRTSKNGKTYFALAITDDTDNERIITFDTMTMYKIGVVNADFDEARIVGYRLIAGLTFTR